MTTRTISQEYAETLRNLEMSLDNLHAEMQRTKQRIDDLDEAMAYLSTCPECVGDVIHEAECTGWCEECGVIYAAACEGQEVTWFDPLTNDLAHALGTLSTNQGEAVKQLWNNEAIQERRAADVLRDTDGSQMAPSDEEISQRAYPRGNERSSP